MLIDEVFEGARVEVTGGMYEGINGTVVEVLTKRKTVAVRLDSAKMNYVSQIDPENLKQRSAIESLAEIDTSDAEDEACETGSRSNSREDLE